MTWKLAKKAIDGFYATAVYDIDNGKEFYNGGIYTKFNTQCMTLVTLCIFDEKHKLWQRVYDYQMKMINNLVDYHMQKTRVCEMAE